MMTRILIISSNIHKALASRQLENCLKLVKNSRYDHHVEILEAGTYEIPFVINTYQQKNPFDGYIGLGLVLNNNQDHYRYIMSHIEACFTHFALHNIVVGNGIITGATVDDFATKIDSEDPCISAYPSAFNAVDCLIKLQQSL